MVLLALPSILLFGNSSGWQQTSQGKVLQLPTGLGLSARAGPTKLAAADPPELKLHVMAALPISLARAWQHLC